MDEFASESYTVCRTAIIDATEETIIVSYVNEQNKDTTW